MQAYIGNLAQKRAKQQAITIDCCMLQTYAAFCRTRHAVLAITHRSYLYMCRREQGVMESVQNQSAVLFFKYKSKSTIYVTM